MAREIPPPALVLAPALLVTALLAVLLVGLPLLLQLAVVGAAGLVLVASLAFPFPGRASSLRLRLRQLLLVTLVLTLPMIRWQGPGNTAVADAALLGVLVFGLAMLARGFPARPPKALLYWWLLYLLAGALTTLGSVEPGRSLLTLAQDLFLLLFWVALYPVLYDDSEEVRVSWLMRVWLAVAVLNSLLVLAGPFAEGAIRDQLTFGGWGGRGVGLFRDPNMAAHYLGMSLLLAPLARVRLRGLRWLFVGGGGLALLLGIAATGSNGAKVALSAGVLAMIVAALLRRTGPSIGVRGFVLSASAFIVLMAALLVADFALRQRTVAGTQGFTAAPRVLRLDKIPLTLEQRTIAWRQALAGFRQSPLGLGPGVLGKSDLRGDREAHSDAFATLAERGPLGLIAFLGFAWAWVRRLAREPEKDRQAELASLARVGTTAFLLVFGLSIDTLHFRHLWFGLALVLPWRGSSQADRWAPRESRRPRPHS